jgi:hypothetical protein
VSGFAGRNEYAADPDGQAQHGDDSDDGELACGKRRVWVHIDLLTTA